MGSGYLFLIPISLVLGGAALGAFFWCLKTNQYEDLDGAAERILFDDIDGEIDFGEGGRTGAEAERKGRHSI